MPEPASFFITGTDTDVGKTFISCGLLEAAAKKGLSTAALKPVAAGAELINGMLKNEDALALQNSMTLDLPYETVNPVCLRQAIAPHIAAEREGVNISLDSLKKSCEELKSLQADFTLIEGAGGWDVPVNEKESLAELPGTLNIPVILVVGIRLGCLNHAMLTVKAIEQQGDVLAGWIANCLDPEMSEAEENIAYLQKHIQAPLLSRVPFIETPFIEASLVETPLTESPSIQSTLIKDKSKQSSCADHLSSFPFSQIFPL